MKIITESEVERHLSMPECIVAMRSAMILVSKGETQLPLRQFMPIDGASGKMAIMPGAIADPWCFGIKLVCKYDRPPSSPLGTHVGMVLIFDAAEGIPLAMIEGSSLTSIRTAAVSAMATDLLARKDARHMLVLGTGEQARRHICAIRQVRSLESISVWGRNKDRGIAFAEGVEAVEGLPVNYVEELEIEIPKADIICTTTSAKAPILFGRHLAPGVHINLVGSAVPTTAEADIDCVLRSRYFVDYRPAALAAAGEFLAAVKAGVIDETHICAEIGEVAAGTRRGREHDDEITVYKSLGVSAQDLAAAHLLVEKAQRESFGLNVELMDQTAAN